MNSKSLAVRALVVLMTLTMLLGMFPMSVSALEGEGIVIDMNDVELDISTATLIDDAYYYVEVPIKVTQNDISDENQRVIGFEARINFAEADGKIELDAWRDDGVYQTATVTKGTRVDPKYKNYSNTTYYNQTYGEYGDGTFEVPDGTGNRAYKAEVTNAGTYKILISAPEATLGFEETGRIMSFYFKVAKDIPNGKYEIALVSEGAGIAAFGKDAAKPAYEYIGGSITVINQVEEPKYIFFGADELYAETDQKLYLNTYDESVNSNGQTVITYHEDTERKIIGSSEAKGFEDPAHIKWVVPTGAVRNGDGSRMTFHMYNVSDKLKAVGRTSAQLPWMRIGYKTDAYTNAKDLNIYNDYVKDDATKHARAWGGTNKPAFVADQNWNYCITDISKGWTGGVGGLVTTNKADATGIWVDNFTDYPLTRVLMRPQGTNGTTPVPGYLKIRYVAFFETEDAAKAFVEPEIELLFKDPGLVFDTTNATAAKAGGVTLNGVEGVIAASERNDAYFSWNFTTEEFAADNTRAMVLFPEDQYPANFKQTDKPYMKIGYRTNIANGNGNTQLNPTFYTMSRIWGASINLDKSGEWSTIIVHLPTAGFKDGEGTWGGIDANLAHPMQQMIFKPYGSGSPSTKVDGVTTYPEDTRVIPADDAMFDINYIAFFENEESAIDYEYPTSTFYSVKATASADGMVQDAQYNPVEVYTEPTWREGAEITLTAEPNEGFVLDGWYDTVTDERLSGNENYTFVVTGDVDVEARFIAASAVKNAVILKVAAPANGTVTVDGEVIEDTFEAVRSIATINAEAAEGYVFAGWTRVSDDDNTTVYYSADAEIDVYGLGDSVTYTPIFAESKQDIYVNENGRIIDGTTEPTKFGYVFAGWNVLVDNDAVTVNEAKFTREATKYNITVRYADGSTETITSKFDSDVTLTGKSADASLWTVDGIDVAYGDTFTFAYPYTKDVEVVETNVSADDVKPMVSLISTSAEADKTVFTAISSVPAGYKIISRGIVLTTDADAVEAMTIETPGVIVGRINSATDRGNSTYKINKIGTGTYYGKAFVVYEDATGAEEIIYG